VNGKIPLMAPRLERPACHRADQQRSGRHLTRKLALPLAAALALVASSTGVQATWYSENIESGADIIMMDLRWPWWPSGTYYANWNSSFNPKPNNISFYAGFTATVPDGPGSLPNPDARVQDAFRPGSVWSFWGSSKDGTPVRFVDVAPNLFIKNVYGGEGLSGTLGGEGWPFIKSKHWYTVLARVWQPVGEASHAYVGRWIIDHADGQWRPEQRRHVVVRVHRWPVWLNGWRRNSDQGHG
jgi:hypothetical protein